MSARIASIDSGASGAEAGSSGAIEPGSIAGKTAYRSDVAR